MYHKQSPLQAAGCYLTNRPIASMSGLLTRQATLQLRATYTVEIQKMQNNVTMRS
jgi:hypothetical protein